MTFCKEQGLLQRFRLFSSRKVSDCQQQAQTYSQSHREVGLTSENPATDGAAPQRPDLMESVWDYTKRQEAGTKRTGAVLKTKVTQVVFF